MSGRKVGVVCRGVRDPFGPEKYRRTETCMTKEGRLIVNGKKDEQLTISGKLWVEFIINT